LLDTFISFTLGAPGRSSNFIGWEIFGALTWAIWLTQNDVVFNRKIIRSPTNVLYKYILLLAVEVHASRQA
jgi:hypothetical protein